MKIYKYIIPIDDEVVIEMPKDAIIFSFQMQNEIPTLWVGVNEDSPGEVRRFSVIGTGHEFNWERVKKFIGTVQDYRSGFVWHLVELKYLLVITLTGNLI